MTGTVFDNMKDDAYVMVWRRSETSKRMVYMGRLAPSEATEEVIQKALGGGYYQCREKEPAEDGSMVFGRSRTFELGGPRKPNGTLEGVGETPQSPANAPAITTPGTPDGSQNILNAAMVSTVVDLLKASKEVKSQAPDIMSYLKPVMEMQGRILEMLLTMMTNNRQQGDPKKDMLDMMASMKDLLSPVQPINPGNPHEVVKNILETIRDVREAADDLGPSRGGDSTDPMAILGKLAEVIVTEQQHRRGGKPRPPALVKEPRVNPPIGKEPVAVTAGEELPPWKRVLKAQGPKLIAQAQAGRDPDAIAALALEFAPANIKGILTEFFSQDTETVVRLMLEELPALANYPQWLGDFVISAQERLGLLPEDDDDDDANLEGLELEEEPTGPEGTDDTPQG